MVGRRNARGVPNTRLRASRTLRTEQRVKEPMLAIIHVGAVRRALGTMARSKNQPDAETSGGERPCERCLARGAEPPSSRTEPTRRFRSISTESLILAQDERWRCA
jgi:hypothetical protein